MLYLILLVYLVVAFFYPVVGLIALVCMIGPVTMSVFKGRYWCGHICPRGSYYDKLVGKVSRNKTIPDFLRGKFFRGFMLLLIFTMFGVQMYFAWATGEQWDECSGTSSSSPPLWALFSALFILRAHGVRSVLWAHSRPWWLLADTRTLSRTST